MTISDELLFEVAYDYYVRNILQKDIAKKLGVSRVQVSKYLKMAVERKIVRIEVIPPKIPQKLESEYETFFKQKFGLKKTLSHNGTHQQPITFAVTGKKEPGSSCLICRMSL